MESHLRERLSQLVSSDEAPDTGDDSDEDLVTNYLAANGANNDNLVPTIHITPQSPNGNHVLEDNLLQLSRIQERIQEMRLSNANASHLEVNNAKSRLSNSCPSLNEPSEHQTNLDDNTPSTDTNSGLNNNSNDRGYKGAPRSRKSRQQQGNRHRSVSVSSGDSDEDVVDGTASAKIRQRSASTAPKEQLASYHQSATTPPTFKEPRYYQGNRHKSPHLMAQFSSLHKSVSTPSIVVDQQKSNSGKKHKRRDLPEPTHVFLQRLIAEHEWARPSGSESDSEEEHVQVGQSQATAAVRSASYVATGTVGHPAGPPVSSSNISSQNRIRTHPLAAHHNSTPSPQLSLAEFLQDDPEDDDSRKRRRKKERSSLFFRKKKDKGLPGNGSGGVAGSVGNGTKQGPPSIHLFDPQQLYHQQKIGLSKVSSAANLKATNNQAKLSHHSQSMSSLRKASISGPGMVQPLTGAQISSNSNFYLPSKASTGEYGKNYEDKDDFGHEDTAGLLESEFIPGEEFSEGGGPAAIRDLETPRHLRIEEDEPETWTQTVTSKTTMNLTPSEIKRQEHIYEFILTESNHCQVLKVIEKIFAEGMIKYLSLPKDMVERLFPCLDNLLDLHLSFLDELRTRQNQSPVVESIADILHSQFSGPRGSLWREAYGSFCAGHAEAVAVFKDLMKSDRRFQQFVRQCSENPLLKKKGVPECLLFVTTRITKYPLLIEPLAKAASREGRPAELELLRQANLFVKEILRDVNARVAEKERKGRLFEIYNRVDPKSTLMYNGRKFKKSDILLADRRLLFEGVATLQQTRNRSLQVNVVLLSDILFFLHENNQKFYFISPEGKPSIVPVRTLIARERPGGSTKSLNLLSTVGYEEEPEVFELEIMQPSTRDDWISGIREAVDVATPGSDSDPDHVEQENVLRKAVDNKYLRLRRLTAELRSKDIDLSHVLESKMKIMSEILEIVHGDKYQKPIPSKLDYTSLVREKKASGQSMLSQEQLLSTLQESCRLASSIYSSVTNLSRSVSSAGEKHSNVYSSPSLPRRAETFSGFDKEQGSGKKIKEIDICDGGEREIVTGGAPVGQDLPGPQPLLMNLDPEQQQAAVQLTHHLNNLMCMVSEHFTTLESVRAELSEIREKANISGGRYKQNQRFEEMRRLQDTLAREQKEWAVKKELLEQEIEVKKVEMQKYQSEIDRGLKDVKEQREQLYRKLEVLRGQGIELGPNLSVLKTDPGTKSHQSSADLMIYSESSPIPASSPQSLSASLIGSGPGSGIRKSSSLTSSSHGILTPANNLATGGSLKKESFANLHLMSATNESKGLMMAKEEIKQQIPVKLSSLSKELSKPSKKSTSSLVINSSNSNQTSGSSSAKGISNLAKPEAVQQLLPFKLSESESSKSNSRYPAQQYLQQQQQLLQQRGAGGPGGSPPIVNTGSLRYSNNTLPKQHQQSAVHHHKVYGNQTAASANNPESGASDDDKVIYF